MMMSLVLTMHKTLVTDWLTYVQNSWKSSFVDPFEVIGPRHLPTLPMPNPALGFRDDIGSERLHSIAQLNAIFNDNYLRHSLAGVMFWSVFVSLCDWMSIGLFWILYRLDGQSSSRWCKKWQWSWETIYGAWREKFNRNDTVPISLYHDWGIWATECRPVFCVRLKVLCLTNFVFNNYESTIKNVGCVLYSITPNLSSGSNAISHCFLSGSCLLRLPFFVVFFRMKRHPVHCFYPDLIVVAGWRMAGNLWDGIKAEAWNWCIPYKADANHTF